jgi:hypothetical protein
VALVNIEPVVRNSLILVIRLSSSLGKSISDSVSSESIAKTETLPSEKYRVFVSEELVVTVSQTL